IRGTEGRIDRRDGVETRSATSEAGQGRPGGAGLPRRRSERGTRARGGNRGGFRVLIKASAGGGGKGMKIVRTVAELQNQIDSARRESAKAFGNNRLLLERYIEEPRHVEFQIFGDAHGEIIHLFQRDFSIL